MIYIYEALLAVFVFLFTIPVWIYLYKHYLGNILADIYVSKIETGQIDLNYLLDEGGVFDELTERIISRFKMNMLADMGQLSNQSKGIEGAEGLGLDLGMGMGVEAATQLLNMVGMRKPPAMLTIKVAQALGQLVENNTKPSDEGEVGRFFPDRP